MAKPARGEWGGNDREGVIASVVIVALAFLAYFPILDNFFTWDDFLWIDRARKLSSNPGQMFGVDVIYFDPLVYLSFWLNYQLNQLHHFWYHLLDLALHAANGVLLYLLVFRHSRDRLAALASGVLFVCAFATVDAVAWSSSRVDLISVFFSLGSLLAFQCYLENGRRQALVLSLLAFVLALGAKGTPLVIPAIMAFMIFQSPRSRRSFATLGFFLAVAAIYCSLLFWKLSAAQSAGSHMRPNLQNLVMAFAELFVPERWLATSVNPLLVAGVMVVLVLVACLPFVHALDRTRRLGVAVMCAGLAPVLVLRDFHFASTLNNAGHLLNSPSHRIYLASAGVACLAGTLLAGLASRIPMKRAVFFVVIAAVSLTSLYELRKRELLWNGSAKYIKGSVEGIALFRKNMVDDCLIGLGNFPMSRGFMRPALAIYCGLEQVMILPMDSIPTVVLDAPEILRYQNRGYYYVYGKTKVHDLSSQFNRLLAISFQYQIASDDREKQRLSAEYEELARQINTTIAVSKAT